MSRSKIALLIAAGVIVVVGPLVYVFLFGFQTVMAVEAQRVAQKNPIMLEVPVPLSDRSISSVAHKKISYFGYEVELPWDDVDDANSKTKGTIHVTAFLSGNTFWFSRFQPKELVNGLIQITKLTPESFRQEFGDVETQSDYAFRRAMLETTPASVGPFTWPRRAAGASQLLLFKAMSMPGADPKIFEVQAPGFRGYQIRYSKGQNPMILDELYSDDGGVELHFSPKSNGPVPTITQPEINRVLQSIHKISAPPAAAAK